MRLSYRARGLVYTAVLSSITMHPYIMSRYKTDINGYKQKVKESIESCRQATLNPDPSDPHSVKYVGISNVPHIFLYFKEEKHFKFVFQSGRMDNRSYEKSSNRHL